MTWKRNSEDYKEFLRLQTKANIRFKTHEEKVSKLQTQMDDLRSTKSDSLLKDPRSAMKLPTCPPPKFSGETVDYIPWKRIWKVTMGTSYMEEVQLMQLKLSIPARTTDLIGLSDIRFLMSEIAALLKAWKSKYSSSMYFQKSAIDLMSERPIKSVVLAGIDSFSCMS